MTSTLPTRRLIPRWRSTVQTLRRLEAASTSDLPKSSPVSDSEAELANATHTWHSTHSPGVLGDVLSFAMDPTLADRAIAVGSEAVRVNAPMSELQRQLVETWGAEQSVPPHIVVDSSSSGLRPFQASIRRLRALLRFAPDNALVLLDFAQLQAAVGKSASAERALLTAVSLAPSNRLVLRTMARFLVHANRPDEGHQLLRRHRRTSVDPWLMASEVALADAAGRTGEFLSKARRLLRDKGAFRPEHLTELAGVVAMEELKGGNLKRAREAQRRALLAPNDNVIAQAVEFEDAFGIALTSPAAAAALTHAAEARLLRAWVSADPDGVVKHALSWHAEEPFSSRPMQLLTALYAFRGELVQAVDWGKAGLTTDPTDRGLLINLAYAYAKGGNRQGAAHSIRRLRQYHQRSAEPYALATEGLLEYREGNFDVGDRLYSAAAHFFKTADQPSIEAYCRVNQALAAHDAQHPRVAEILHLAEELLSKHPSPDSLMLLRSHSADILRVPDQQPLGRRNLTQWVFNAPTNTLTEKPGISAVGASPLVFAERRKK